ncbi:carbohydrate porin [Xylanibacter oryzae]|uniref:carbohydrate porin n=1 Tax=Xylanibacter oryzae TaxID=185293 RepID=UPI0004BAB629|nr:carbohydrate porin [Xylanibacter oryzae]
MRLLHIYISLVTMTSSVALYAQSGDTLKDERFSLHGQVTVISQYKPSFHATYSGANSLVSEAETERSLTTTLFLGVKLWNGGGFFMSPEISGGSGLSSSLGVGSSTNGEAYRVDSPAPSFELGRLYFTQIIPLSKQRTYQCDDINKLGGTIPTEYLALTIGKICVSDIFDANQYSHDPRTQFMSWGIMNNGAWDFAANTKGYTPSVVIEWIRPHDALRYGISLLPKVANGMEMNWHILKSSSNSIEYTHRYSLEGRKGAIRLFSFINWANMGNYEESLKLNPSSPNLYETEKSGRVKYGFGVNVEQEMNDFIGVFFRAGWNDGRNETWAFTEIDRTVSLGVSGNGSKWNRKADTFGVAHVVSGLSASHRDYLKAGGKGFELGDGGLNYGLENLSELYYSFALKDNLFLSGAYQFIINPGYNRNRGPVNVLSLRIHAVF